MEFKFATSTIADGNMAFKYGSKNEVLSNRHRFLDQLGLPTGNSVVMDSRHQARLELIDKNTPNEDFGLENSILADALITQTPNTPLLLTTADCLPIGLWDESTDTIALIHLSRHTFELDLIENTTEAMGAIGTKLEELKVFIGPHIHKSSYFFSLPLDEEGVKLSSHIERRGSKAYVDLPGAVIKTFTDLKIKAENITVSPIDTYSDTKHFSHVEASKNKFEEGRLISVACLLSA